jgi:hypothetical protein
MVALRGALACGAELAARAHTLIGLVAVTARLDLNAALKRGRTLGEAALRARLALRDTPADTCAAWAAELARRARDRRAEARTLARGLFARPDPLLITLALSRDTHLLTALAIAHTKHALATRLRDAPSGRSSLKLQALARAQLIDALALARKA